MANIKKGIGVFATNNCINCSKCVYMCKIPDCISQTDSNHKRSISIDPTKCINCGVCLRDCSNHGLEYNDDTEKFLADLKAGEEIVIAIDPAFYFVYTDKAQAILAHLQKLGVRAFYNASYGYDLALWAYVHWIRMRKNKPAVIAPCISAVKYIEHYQPSMLKNLAPVKDGIFCLATYVRKYLGEKRKIAYISPCIGMGEEIREPKNKGTIQYNVTFHHLLEQIKNDLPQEGTFTPVKLDLEDYGFGSLMPISSSIRRSLEYYLGISRPFIEVQDAVSLFQSLKNFKSHVQNSKSGIAIVTNCPTGCVLGTGTDTQNTYTVDIFSMYTEKRNEILKNPDFVCDIKTPEAQLEKLDRHFSGININDFLVKHEDRYKEPAVIPENVFDEIFTKMRKTTEKSRHLDCQACGYLTCRDMAAAIIKGHNQIENCIQYDREEKTRLLTTNHTTHLLNTQIFYDRIEQLIHDKKLENKSVLRFHISGILLINQLFGFDTGTITLVEFAKKAVTFLKSGEELFQDTGPSFFAIIEKEHVNQFIFSINHIELPTLSKIAPDFSNLTVKCGIYNFTGKETKLGTIVNNVNSAYRLTKNKNSANVIFYDDELNEKMIRSMVTAQRIPQALEKKEFSIMFQPKVSSKNHTLVGAEALIRWTHDGDIIPPSEFIGIAESSGYIKQIDYFMLSSVCKHISTWLDIGIESVRISINFSKDHFSTPGIAERICAIVDSEKVPHHCIEIEITETSFVDEVENIKNGIIELHKNGIKTSIDDFGTGYSSISLLSVLPFDVIKFDKTIIDSVEPDSRSQIVVSNIVNMAKDLSMEVVAEGIDNQEKLKIMEDIGCDMIQGYIFDKPLSPQDFLKRLAHPKYQ